MMPYTTQKTDAYHKHAEIFTPPGVVALMVLEDGIRACVRDVDKTIFDPACGHGQFPCFALACKLFYGVDRLDEDIALRALQSLYGIDIQQSSVDATKRHLLQTLTDSYKFFTGNEFTRLAEATDIVNENFICGDSLKIMKRWASRTIELF